MPPSKLPETTIAAAVATAPADLGKVVVAAADTEVAAAKSKARAESANFILRISVLEILVELVEEL